MTLKKETPLGIVAPFESLKRPAIMDAMSDPISESAKATQEIAKAASKSLEVAGNLGGWLDRIFGAGVEHSVKSIWTNRVRERSIAGAIHSWERLELLLHKTEERLRRKGITQFRLVQPKLALPLLQNATMENEDDLHSLWASLLSAALDPTGDEIHRKYISILADLTGPDAVVLRAIWNEWLVDDKSESWGSTTVRYGPGVRGTEEHDERSVISLNRLGLIASSYTEIHTYAPAGYEGDRDAMEHSDAVRVVHGDLKVVVVTRLGEDFCRAVMSD